MSLKGKDNAWITKSGRFIEVGYMGHNEYASDWYKEKYPGEDPFWLDKMHDDHEKHNTQYPYEELHYRGWVRLLSWQDGKTKVVGKTTSYDGRLDTMNPSLTHKQKETLHQWCMENGYRYEDLF